MPPKGAPASWTGDSSTLRRLWTAGLEGLVTILEIQVEEGCYLFANEASARVYCDTHTRQLEGFGVSGIFALFFDVTEALTSVARGPIADSAGDGPA